MGQAETCGQTTQVRGWCGVGRTMRPEHDAHTTRPHCLQWCRRSLSQFPNFLPHASSEHSSASWSGCHRRRGTWRAAAPANVVFVTEVGEQGAWWVTDSHTGTVETSSAPCVSVTGAPLPAPAKAVAGGEGLAMGLLLHGLLSLLPGVEFPLSGPRPNIICGGLGMSRTRAPTSAPRCARYTGSLRTHHCDACARTPPRLVAAAFCSHYVMSSPASPPRRGKSSTGRTTKKEAASVTTSRVFDVSVLFIFPS